MVFMGVILMRRVKNSSPPGMEGGAEIVSGKVMPPRIQNLVTIARAMKEWRDVKVIALST
jgi:hypothetical protein